MQDHGSYVKGVAYCPDGTLFATACNDGTARIFHGNETGKARAAKAIAAEAGAGAVGGRGDNCPAGHGENPVSD